MSAQIAAKEADDEDMPEEEDEDHHTEVVCQNLKPEEQEALLLTTVPIIKLSESSGHYLIGNKQVTVTKEGDALSVHISDDETVAFDDYVKAHAQEYCLEILQSMEDNKKSFQETMLELLEANNASEDTIAHFKASTDKNEAPFADIVKAIRDRDVNQLPDDYGK